MLSGNVNAKEKDDLEQVPAQQLDAEPPANNLSHFDAEPSANNLSHLESLPRDVLGLVLTYSKNYSTMFNVSKNLCDKVSALLAQDASLVTFSKDETCYVVSGSVCLNDDNMQPRPLTRNLMEPSRRQIFKQGVFSLAAMVTENEMKKNVIYIERSLRGINCTLLTAKSVVVERGNGSSSTLINEPVTSEITAVNLPLLDLSIFNSSPFDVNNYGGLCERIVAILGARGLIRDHYQAATIHVFKNKADAEAYAATRYNSMFKLGPTMGIVHECQMKETVKVVCVQREVRNKFGFDRENSNETVKVLPMTSMLKSNLLLADNSYPCNGEGKPLALVEAPAPISRCVVM